MSLIKNIILVSVAVVLFGALLIPVVSDAANDSVIDVIIVDGQSNAEDWGSFSTEINTIYSAEPVTDLYYYGSPTSTTHYSDSTATIATYGIQPMYKGGAWVVGGYAPVLCNEYAAKNGHEICYINIGSSGRPISALSPNGAVGSWGFDVVDNALSLLREKYHALNMIGWIWAQGEADKDTAINTYTSYFTTIQNKFASYGANQCYIIHTREYYGGNATEAQQIIADTDPNVTMTCLFTENFTVENGDLRTDGEIHYSQKGRCIIAEALAEIIPTKAGGAEYTLLWLIPTVVCVALVVGVLKLIVSRNN